MNFRNKAGNNCVARKNKDGIIVGCSSNGYKAFCDKCDTECPVRMGSEEIAEILGKKGVA
jgi:hypothetical protein